MATFTAGIPVSDITINGIKGLGVSDIFSAGFEHYRIADFDIDNVTIDDIRDLSIDDILGFDVDDVQNVLGDIQAGVFNALIGNLFNDGLFAQLPRFTPIIDPLSPVQALVEAVLGAAAGKTYEYVVRFGVQKLAIDNNGLAGKNPDVQPIFDTYFDSTSQNTNREEISSAGFSDNPVTLHVLDEITTIIGNAANRLPVVQDALQAGVTSDKFEVNVQDFENANLSLPDGLFFVNGNTQDGNRFKELWKYSGVSNVPGFLAGGVGEGGPPPFGAATLLDSRSIQDSTFDILLEGGFLEITANYVVRIEDTFDFQPGGGGLEDFLNQNVTTIGGVEALRALERAGLAFDVPFFTEFEATFTTSGVAIIVPPISSDTSLLV